MRTITLSIKQSCWASFLGLAVVSFPALSLAITVKEIPNPRQENRGWVADTADILNSSTEAEINRQISGLEAKNGSEIAVVTVPETAPASTPKEFATTLFNYWGIGKQEQNNGVLFLISKGDRRVEIETGYGVEGILPDAQIGSIIEQKITPQFKRGDFDGGTLAATKALVQTLEGETYTPLPNLSTKVSKSSLNSSTETYRSPSNSNTSVPWYLWLAGIGGAGAAVIALRKMMTCPVFVELEGRSRTEDRNSQRPIHCSNCRQPMEKLDSKSLLSHLSQPEKVAQKLGSIRVEGRQCSDCCQRVSGKGIHLRTYVLDSNRFKTCSTCKELTVTRVIKTLEQATQSKQGKRLITDTCHCCSYSRETEETVPRLPPPPPPSSGGSSGGYYGGYVGGSSGSSSSNGGGSFGGGSSGGGGAGGSW